MTLELKDPTLLESRAFVAGKWETGARQFAVKNPATGEEIVKVADMGVDDMRGAIDAAYAAQKAWARRTAKDRCAILLRWQSLMLENADDLAKILTAEMGKPLAEAKGEIAYGASFIQWFAEEARRVYGDVIPGHQEDKRIIVLKQPIGVVGSITPWNFPNAMIARKVGPALASGCAFVGRPAEKTPLSALAMAALAERAGVPAGVLSIVTGTDSKGLGLELCTNPKVRKLTFTGSTEVGRILMRQCAHDIKKLSLELGGNAPFIVFDDADLDKAVEGALIAKYRNSGQTCVCANRIYVQRGVLEQFAAKLAAATAALRVGNGAEAGVNIGPLIDAAGLAKVEEHVSDALSKGARVLTGGARSDLGGTFYQPTVLADVKPGMKILSEETFGPVAPLIAFDTVDDAIEMANDTEFGLASYFYARDLSRVWKVSEALEYGMVGINTGLISTAEVPFGGIKSSGLGREGSKYGIDDYLEIKYLCMSVDA
ncbi:MAG: NAD-dependent succinate-semialdehyde dehydrogenase [Rhizobiaceae bacterium]|nr:MAG: NAD-dependent succinate-semialdehyde dehydrogenase [Rhizobiaceae bacterium]CAG1016213.1 succinate-semialdehyde dehydrogenase / glutarate-semialdehyde dehydrogenase [Rhizobiaceae bacterium]